MHDLDSYLEENILKDNSWGDSAEKSTKQDYSQLEIIGDLVLQSPSQAQKGGRTSELLSKTRDMIQLQEISFVPEVPDLETYFYSYFFEGAEPKQKTPEVESSFLKVSQDSSAEDDHFINPGLVSNKENNLSSKKDERDVAEQKVTTLISSDIYMHPEEDKIHDSSENQENVVDSSQAESKESAEDSEGEEEPSEDESSVESNPYEDKHFYDKSDDSGILQEDEYHRKGSDENIEAYTDDVDALLANYENNAMIDKAEKKLAVSKISQKPSDNLALNL